MIINIMLATLLTTNLIDCQEVRIAVVLYATSKVLQQLSTLIKAITKFVRVVKGGKTSHK